MDSEKTREKDRTKDACDSLEIIAEQSKGPDRCCYCHTDSDEQVEPLYDKNNLLVASYHPSCRTEEQERSTAAESLELRVNDSVRNYKKYLIRKNKRAKYSVWEKVQQTEEVVRSIVDIYELIEDFFGITEHKLQSGMIEKNDHGTIWLRSKVTYSIKYSSNSMGIFFKMLALPLLPITLPITFLYFFNSFCDKKWTTAFNRTWKQLTGKCEKFYDIEWDTRVTKQLELMKQLHRELNARFVYLCSLSQKYEGEELESKIKKYLAKDLTTDTKQKG